MQKSVFLASAAALITFTGAAQAADAIVYEETPEPVVVEQRIKGAFEVGLWGNNFDQSDDEESDTPFGGYGTAFVHIAATPSFIINVDAHGEFLDIGDEDYNEYTPNFATVLGTSLNYRFGMGTIGVFGGAGATNAETNGAGYLGGLQGSVDFNATTIFGQVGYADIRVDEEDSGFTGGFGRIGVIHGFSDAFAMSVDGGYGESKDYEDEGDDGKYWTVGLKGALRVTDLPLFATAGYEYRKYEANTEDDADEHSFRLGLSIPFGGSTTAKDTFNPFQTPVAPYRAASYGEVLD